MQAGIVVPGDKSDRSNNPVRQEGEGTTTLHSPSQQPPAQAQPVWRHVPLQAVILAPGCTCNKHSHLLTQIDRGWGKEEGQVTEHTLSYALWLLFSNDLSHDHSESLGTIGGMWVVAVHKLSSTALQEGVAMKSPQHRNRHVDTEALVHGCGRTPTWFVMCNSATWRSRSCSSSLSSASLSSSLKEVGVHGIESG